VTEADSYFRYPHIHADLVTFVAENDVWLAPLDGGRAWRVSADQVPVARPRISPDGTLIAWASTRDGAPEVHVAPVDGGQSRRLTFWGSAQTSVLGWTAEGEVLALSSVGRMSRAHPWAFAVPLDGGPARQLPYGRVGGVAREPGGEQVLLSSAVMGRSEPAYWKRYRGGTAGKLWIGVEGDFARVHADVDGNIDSPMWTGAPGAGRIAFLSDHEGVGQLWSSLPDGSDLRRHSEHEFYARNASTDGARVVYHSAGDLYLVDDLADARPRRLDVRLGGPRVNRQPHPVPAGRHLGAVAPDGDARSSVIEVRGTIHRVTHRDGPARVLASAPGVRNRLPLALPDGASVWVTDAEGEDGLEFADGRRVAVGRLGRVEELTASPDGAHLAVANRDGLVLLVRTADGTVREIDRGASSHATDLAFSPDSQWLVWSHALGVEEVPRQLRLARIEDGSVADLTPPRFTDYAPTFTTDGKHLAFLSMRDFDPVYDAHVFDLSFPVACRPYLLTLAADTLSPFGPQPQGRALGKGDDDAVGKDGKDGKDAKEPKAAKDAKGAEDGDAPAGDAEDAPAVTRLDLEGLADRIVPFPVASGHYSGLRAVKGGVVWLEHPLAGELGTSRATPEDESERSSLQRFDFATRRAETLVDELDRFEVSGDGARLAVVDEGELRIVPADHRVGKDERDEAVTVDLSRVRVTIDPVAEWRQMFDETARLMRDNFWRTDMGGLDWPAVQRRYRPLVERLGSHSDLVDLLWELQGEPGTSHAYVQPAGHGVAAARRQGMLGADLVRDAAGVWRVARVLPGESSDPAARSPLGAPGVSVRAGESILEVDGLPVDTVTGPAPLLVGTAGKPVELTVGAAASDGGDASEGGTGAGRRTVVVVPLADEEALRYHAWVADRRAYVHERSAGALGYLHVPDMVANGWAQVHRDLRTEMAREGLVVDVRENRGGHTSQLIIEKLNRRIIGWGIVRDFTPHSYPEIAPRGPLVSVADEFSGSDGDIVNAAFQALKLGPVVGVRTWGGVVGIDGRYSLVDGTGVTQPRYSTWMEGYGWGLENHGVDPDVEVVCTPQDWAAGLDPQLDEGIRIALAALAETPAATAPGIPPL
jgi:tricorn protease